MFDIAAGTDRALGGIRFSIITIMTTEHFFSQMKLKRYVAHFTTHHKSAPPTEHKGGVSPAI